MVKIAPSLLSADFCCLKEEIECIEKAGADWLHLDVMDGHFVPNITFGPPIIKSLRSCSSLFFDTHLMIENPDRYIEDFAKAGSDLITIHAEPTVHLHRTIQKIKDCGKKVGVSLNPSSPLSLLEYVLPELDLVLIMSVNPGFGGQKFIKEVLPKIEKLREIINKNNFNTLIEVDGGVTKDNASMLIEAGVDVLVAGTAVFGAPDRKIAIKEIRNTL